MYKTKLIKKETPDHFLTIREACEILHCHPNTLRKWDRMGILIPMRFGTRGDRRYRKEDVLNVLEGKPKKNTQAKAPLLSSIMNIQQTTHLLEKELKQKGDKQASVKLSNIQKDITSLIELVNRLLNHNGGPKVTK